MATPFELIEDVIRRDPGSRGVGRLRSIRGLEPAARALLDIGTAAIVTGFYIPGANACETDGPPGAWSLGQALRQTGARVSYLTDQHCRPVLERAGLFPLHTYPPAPRDRADAIISIERVGRASDRCYYNMRGIDISEWTEPLDDHYLKARADGALTIAIGDGGNEIGMGNVYDQVREVVPLGSRISCVVECDHLILAGVSNWGAWGLCAALSILRNELLLPAVEEVEGWLKSLVVAGAVDGVTGRAELSVDALPWPHHAAILTELHTIVHR